MPELPEVEVYRRLAEKALQRLIVAVETPDAWYLKGGIEPSDLTGALVGRHLSAARRIGKRLLLDTSDTSHGAPRMVGSHGTDGSHGAVGSHGSEGSDRSQAADRPPGKDGNGNGHGPTIGLRFGMTGCLVVDGAPGVDHLLYSAKRHEPRHERFALAFEGGGTLTVQDPRRLGGVELDPDEDVLGPDVLDIGVFELGRALGAFGSGGTALKARLVDQSRIAGVGNLVGDEVLWRAGLAPRRPADSLSFSEIRCLHRHLVSTANEMIDMGGSSTGDLIQARRNGGRCPTDGEGLVKDKIGGRTTWWCPRHQV